MIKRADWLAIGKDRAAVLLLIGMVILAVVVIVTTVLRIHISDIQVPVRFTGYGQTNIYRDQWYNHLSYAAFAVLICGLNGFLAVKTYQINRMLSLGFLGLSVFLLILVVVISNAIFTLTPSL
jgi:hypothetical protein